MTDLDPMVSFFEARLDEDFEAARLVVGASAMAGYLRGAPVPRWISYPESGAEIHDTTGTPHVKFVWARERDHILRHDPARVLASVAADRRLIRWWHSLKGLDSGPGTPAHLAFGMACTAIKLRCLVFTDHPDYDERWRPQT